MIIKLFLVLLSLNLWAGPVCDALVADLQNLQHKFLTFELDGDPPQVLRDILQDYNFTVHAYKVIHWDFSDFSKGKRKEKEILLKRLRETQDNILDIQSYDLNSENRLSRAQKRHQLINQPLTNNDREEFFERLTDHCMSESMSIKRYNLGGRNPKKVNVKKGKRRFCKDYISNDPQTLANLNEYFTYAPVFQNTHLKAVNIPGGGIIISRTDLRERDQLKTAFLREYRAHEICLRKYRAINNHVKCNTKKREAAYEKYNQKHEYIEGASLVKGNVDEVRGIKFLFKSYLINKFQHEYHQDRHQLLSKLKSYCRPNTIRPLTLTCGFGNKLLKGGIPKDKVDQLKLDQESYFKKLAHIQYLRSPICKYSQTTKQLRLACFKSLQSKPELANYFAKRVQQYTNTGMPLDEAQNQIVMHIQIDTRGSLEEFMTKLTDNVADLDNPTAPEKNNIRKKYLRMQIKIHQISRIPEMKSMRDAMERGFQVLNERNCLNQNGVLPCQSRLPGFTHDSIFKKIVRWRYKKSLCKDGQKSIYFQNYCQQDYKAKRGQRMAQDWVRRESATNISTGMMMMMFALPQIAGPMIQSWGAAQFMRTTPQFLQ